MNISLSNILNYFVYCIFVIIIAFKFFFQEDVNKPYFKNTKNKITFNENPTVNQISGKNLLMLDNLISTKINHNNNNEPNNILKNLNYKKKDIKNKNFFDNNIIIKDRKSKNFASLKIKPLHYVNNSEINKNKFLINPTQFISKNKLKNKNKKFLKNDNKVDTEERKKEIVKIGKNFLDKGNETSFFFKWPLNLKNHDQIYFLLTKCLGVRGVIINSSQYIFSINGKLDQSTLNKFSKILRNPTNIYSNAEKKDIDYIKKKYKIIGSNNYYRMFPREVDYYIFGKFIKNLDDNFNLKNFSGTYKIIDSKLFIDKIRINDKLIDLKLNLSMYCN